jgi:hypothetical protein
VHFLDAWSSLPPLDLLRLLVAPACLVLAVLVPGRAMARIAALGITAVIPFLRELAPSGFTAAGWVALWCAIAWLAGMPVAAARPARSPRLGGMEPGAVGLLVGGALIVVLLAAVARQNLGTDETRRAALGVLLVGLGLVHLMVRRDVRRAALAFGAFGLGLGLVASLARAGEVAPTPAFPHALLATAAAVALAARLAANRESLTGSAWVSDAHDLHD